MRLVCVLALLLVISTGAIAGMLTIEVAPQNPTTATPITLNVWDMFGQPDWVFSYSTFSTYAGKLFVNVYMLDTVPLNPDPPITLPAKVGGPCEIGTLAARTWNVTAKMYVESPGWGGTSPVGTGTSSFTVVPVPEPSSLMALVCGLGTFGGMMARRKTR